jgi:hypothetical protein
MDRKRLERIKVGILLDTGSDFNIIHLKLVGTHERDGELQTKQLQQNTPVKLEKLKGSIPLTLNSEKKFETFSTTDKSSYDLIL